MKIIGKYGSYRKLGNQERGSVHLCKDVNIPTDYFYAIKKVKLDCYQEELPPKLFETDFKYVVQFQEFFKDKTYLYIVMKYCYGSPLKDQIDNPKIQFNIQIASQIALQVAKGIQELNKIGISHKDIKPANILCNEYSSNIFLYGCWDSKDTQFKLCDLGLSKYDSYADTVEVSTLFYMAPELLLGTSANYGEKVDVWSLGMVLFEMLAGENYYKNIGEYYEIQKQPQEQDKVTEKKTQDILDEDVRLLILGMLKVNPKERFSNNVVIEKLESIIKNTTDYLTRDYEFINHIGKGSSGSVGLYKHNYTGQYYAIKGIPLTCKYEKHLADRLSKEKLKNVVKFYETFQQGTKFYIVMEFCNGRSLDYLIHKSAQEYSALDILSQIARGIKELKDNGILHRDIKPSNVVCIESQSKHIKLKQYKDGDRVYKICDIGASKSADLAVSGFVGTRLYMAPELASENPELQDMKVDVWSLGILAYETIMRKQFYEGNLSYEKLALSKTQKMQADVRLLILGMLKVNPKDRFTIEDVIEKLDQIQRMSNTPQQNQQSFGQQNSQPIQKPTEKLPIQTPSQFQESDQFSNQSNPSSQSTEEGQYTLTSENPVKKLQPLKEQPQMEQQINAIFQFLFEIQEQDSLKKLSDENPLKLKEMEPSYLYLSDIRKKYKEQKQEKQNKVQEMDNMKIKIENKEAKIKGMTILETKQKQLNEDLRDECQNLEGMKVEKQQSLTKLSEENKQIKSSLRALKTNNKNLDKQKESLIIINQEMNTFLKYEQEIESLNTFQKQAPQINQLQQEEELKRIHQGLEIFMEAFKKYISNRGSLCSSGESVFNFNVPHGQENNKADQPNSNGNPAFEQKDKDQSQQDINPLEKSLPEMEASEQNVNQGDSQGSGSSDVSDTVSTKQQGNQ